MPSTWSSILCLLLSLGLGLGVFPQPADAGPTDPRPDEVQQAIEHAVDLMQAKTPQEARTIRRREDLEQALSQIVRIRAGTVLFYDVVPSQGAPTADTHVWAVVRAESGSSSYELHSFAASEAFTELSVDFNGLISQLNLSISEEQALPLAQFFIRCCVPGGPSEVVSSDDSLRHSVERYYLSIFGDTPRMLDASFQWWKDYHAIAERESVPARATGHVAVKRLLLTFGADPELQEWDLDVSHDGRIRILAVKPVFPKEGRWVFYDFHSTLGSLGGSSVPPHIPLPDR